MRFGKWKNIPEGAVPHRWTGGPFRPRIRFSPSIRAASQRDVIVIFEEYLRDCGKWFVFYEIVRLQLRGFLERVEPLLKPEYCDNLFGLGPTLPGSPQSPGKSAVASITQGQLIEALAEGGDYDSVLCRSLLVFLYSRWDESYRLSLARAAEIDKPHIKCDLMGEIRKVRNYLVHPHAVVPAEDEFMFNVLPWPKLAGHWELTPGLFTSFMEQANSMEVRIE